MGCAKHFSKRIREVRDQKSALRRESPESEGLSPDAPRAGRGANTALARGDVARNDQAAKEWGIYLPARVCSTRLRSLLHRRLGHILSRRCTRTFVVLVGLRPVQSCTLRPRAQHAPGVLELSRACTYGSSSAVLDECLARQALN